MEKLVHVMEHFVCYYIHVVVLSSAKLFLASLIHLGCYIYKLIQPKGWFKHPQQELKMPHFLKLGRALRICNVTRNINEYPNYMCQCVSKER